MKIRGNEKMKRGKKVDCLSPGISELEWMTEKQKKKKRKSNSRNAMLQIEAEIKEKQRRMWESFK
jgi:hypothetical protein